MSESVIFYVMDVELGLPQSVGFRILAPDDGSIGEFIDPDLLADPTHEKRFQHFKGIDWSQIETPVAAPKPAETLLLWWLTLALTVSIVAAILWNFNFRLVSTNHIAQPIRVKLSSQKYKTESTQGAVASRVEARAEAIEESVIEHTPSPNNLIGSSQGAVDIENPSPTSEKDLAGDHEQVEQNKIYDQSMIQAFVRGKTGSHRNTITGTNPPLSARGLIFDPRQRQRIESERERNLSRWQPPSEKIDYVGSERAYFVIEGKCMTVSKNNANPLRYAMGENSGFHEDIAMPVDCDKVLFNGKITRDDIVPTDVGDGR